MRCHTRDLLTLLISLFILGSCENPSGVGLDVSPGKEVVGQKTDTVTLHTVTFKDDSSRYTSMNRTLYGASLSQSTFGYFDDPIIGKTIVNLALNMGRPTTVPRIRDDAQIDSVILVLPYGLDYFGDTSGTSSFTIQVRQLDEIFVASTYSSKQWVSKPLVVGSKTVNRFQYTDSINVVQHINDKDSVVRVVPQLRIPLSADFFKSLLSESVDSALVSTATGFRSHVKGLYLSIEEASQSGVGGIITFAGIDNISGVELTFRQPNGLDGDDADIDTVRTFLATGSAGLASSITREYTAEIKEQIDNPQGHFETVYLQAPAGLRARVTLPYIDQLKGRNIVVNKAELVIYAETDQVGTFDHQAPRLTLYREDIAGQRQPVPDGDTRVNSAGQLIGDSRSLFTNFGGAYNETQKRYVFYLTSFIQDIVQGKINNHELFLAPASIADMSVPTLPAVNTGGRAVVGGGNNPDYRMKLNIYYTEPGN